MLMRLLATSIANLVFSFAAIAQSSDVPRPFQRNDGQWGFVNENHCWVSNLAFQEVTSFSEGLAAVKLPDGWSYINTRGQIAFGLRVAHARAFSEGMANVLDRATDRIGFIDTRGRWVIAPQFLDARPFSEGLAAVLMEGGSILGGPYAFISRSGNIAINPQRQIVYGTSDGFSGGLARLGSPITNAELGDQFINTLGHPAFSGRFFLANDFSEGIALVMRTAGGRFEAINSRGINIFTLGHGSFALNFSEGLAATAIPGGDGQTKRWGFSDTAGRMVIPPSYQDAWSFSEGLAAIKLADKWGFIDKDGRQVIPPQFERIGSYGFNERLGFQRGHARVKLFGSERHVSIDRSGRVLTQPNCIAR